MKTISLKEAFEILQRCSAVIIDNVVAYPCLSELNGDPENEFLYIGWSGDDGEDYRAIFAEEENETVKVVGSSMFLKDLDGEGQEDVQITILEPKNLE